MRITTSMIYSSGANQLTSLQAALNKTQQQIAANTRILSPSDDPIAAARVLNVTQRQTLNTQYGENRKQAQNSLNLEETSLKSLTTQIQNLQTQVVEAGNSGYTDEQRKYIATEMRNTLSDIMGLANTKDSDGNYLFSGYMTSTQPFTSTAAGATYNGDQGIRNTQVDSVRQMAENDTGYSVFQNNAKSATFNLDASGTFNSADLSSFSVTDQTAVTGDKYQVTFDGSGNYSVYDITTDPGMTTKLTGGAYTGTSSNPQTISYAGWSFTVAGTRTASDTLTVNTTKAQSGNQSLFSTLTDMINLLEDGTSDVTGKVNLGQGLAAANSDLSSALDTVLTVRASVGARLNELDSLDSAGDDLDIQYSKIISQEKDLDYNKAASDLAMQKLVLEAAQSSFAKVSGLSLFNYL